MTDSNPYAQFREDTVFADTQDLINDLTMYLEEYHPEVADRWEENEAVQSILSDLEWDAMERQGSHTKGSSLYVPYQFERQGLRVRVSAELDTESRQTEHVTCTVTLGHEMDGLLPGLDEQETLHFTIHRGGAVVAGR